MKFVILPILAALCLSLAAPIQAEGDASQGKSLAYTCTGCHGVPEYRNAYPQYKVPKIAGQKKQYLINALKAYRNGERNHPTMGAQAGSFSDEEIEHIATYISQQPVE